MSNLAKFGHMWPAELAERPNGHRRLRAAMRQHRRFPE
jgi:hypothetical protein